MQHKSKHNKLHYNQQKCPGISRLLRPVQVFIYSNERDPAAEGVQVKPQPVVCSTIVMSVCVFSIICCVICIWVCHALDTIQKSPGIRNVFRFYNLWMGWHPPSVCVCVPSALWSYTQRRNFMFPSFFLKHPLTLWQLLWGICRFTHAHKPDHTDF